MVSGPVGAWRANRNKWLTGPRFCCDADPKVTHCHHLQKASKSQLNSSIFCSFTSIWLTWMVKVQAVGVEISASGQWLECISSWLDEWTYLAQNDQTSAKLVLDPIHIKSCCCSWIDILIQIFHIAWWSCGKMQGKAIQKHIPMTKHSPNLNQIEMEPQQSWQRERNFWCPKFTAQQYTTLICRDPHWLLIMVEWW